MWLLNYSASRLDVEIMYDASDMCLDAYYDASYLSVINSRSRARGYFFLSQKPTPGKPPATCPINIPVHVIYKIIKIVMGSAAELEIGTG